MSVQTADATILAAQFYQGRRGRVKEAHVARCDLCGKTTAYGRNIRHKHSGRWERKAPKTNRTFKANVQNKTLVIDGIPLRLKICTRCLRTTLKATA